jgi:hypothetical protein
MHEPCPLEQLPAEANVLLAGTDEVTLLLQQAQDVQVNVDELVRVVDLARYVKGYRE